MKGGLTSGLVYPPAIREIARAFRLHSIGGTSAGAIAAALAAAAEFRRRRTGDDTGFELLGGLSEWLGADGNLRGLFRPNTATRAPFATVADLLAARGWWSRVAALVRHRLPVALAGAVPGLAYLYLALASTAGATRWLHVALAVVVAGAGSAALATAAFVWELIARLPANGYGLATGRVGDDPTTLCTWLARELETIAGLEIGETPLTFGMLWRPNDAHARGCENRPAGAAIDLQMMTTCISEGRPYTFPTRTNRFYCKRADLERYFPAHVVSWIERYRRDAGHQFEGFVPLPPAGDLPVIVATRMSLAFPVLLSAVPLYALDYTDRTPRERRLPARVWFSDGGIASNFPVALFDAPLPTRPTLAINLVNLPADESEAVRITADGDEEPADSDPARSVTMPRTNRDGRLFPFAAVGNVTSFVLAILSTMQNWADTTQAALPGFRDRIVTIGVYPGEGGLNLHMGPDLVRRLQERGAEAGRRLVERFATPSTLAPIPAGEKPPMNWENQRWARLRTSLGAVRSYLTRFDRAWSAHDHEQASYAALVESADPATLPQRVYPLSADPAALHEVRELGDRAAELGRELNEARILQRKLPSPPPELGLRAPLEDGQGG